MVLISKFSFLKIWAKKLNTRRNGAESSTIAENDQASVPVSAVESGQYNKTRERVPIRIYGVVVSNGLEFGRRGFESR